LACFPLFWLINTGSLAMHYLALTIFSFGLGLANGPQAALYSEMFPASVRFSGVSLSYALGAILGGAFAPTIATALVQATGGTEAVSLCLVGMTLVSLVAVSLVRDRSGIDLPSGISPNRKLERSSLTGAPPTSQMSPSAPTDHAAAWGRG
jgi:MFS family permease